MPRPRPPYLHKYQTKQKRIVWYVRKPGQKKVRLRADYGTPEFMAAYNAAVAGAPVPSKASKRAAAGSLRWLWDEYHKTGDWAALSPATRKQRENIMLHVLEKSADKPFKAIKKSDIAAGRDKRVATPAQARNFLDLMRGLFRWATEAGHVNVDPTENVRNPPKVAGPGFEVWTEDDEERYLERWPRGTRERVWFDVLRFTGLRRGDAVTLGKQHVRNGIINIKTEKSGERITVTLPVAADLEATLKAGPLGDLTFIVGKNGKPLTKETFGNFFREACNSAGVKKSAHGIRKLAATVAAQNGATESELQAMFAWTNGQMPSHYTRAANRAMIGMKAGHKLVGKKKNRAAIGSLSEK
jgi:integrase